jgi:hypothetical protein
MDREEIRGTISMLAMSQGSYGRLLRSLDELEKNRPEEADRFYEALKDCTDPVDLIIKLES